MISIESVSFYSTNKIVTDNWDDYMYMYMYMYVYMYMGRCSTTNPTTQPAPSSTSTKKTTGNLLKRKMEVAFHYAKPTGQR